MKSRIVRLAVRTFISATTIVSAISENLDARQQERTSVEPIIEEIPPATESIQPAGLPRSAETSAVEPQSGGPAQSSDQSAPLQFKIGDATITPVGFMDLTN